jgi:hypothetical protein
MALLRRLASVLLPVASLGLWGLFSWGVVVWLIVAIFEITMYLGFPQLFGQSFLRVGFHVLSILVYLSLRVSVRFLKNRK